MIVLGVDTALDDVSAGLLLPDGRVVERSFRHERDALRRLAGLIRDVLREGDVRARDLDVVACTRGPGSFTGIRVGVSAARALADACGARMAGVSTLRALCMAAEAREGDVRLALISCRPGEVYAGLYRLQPDGGWEAVRPDAALALTALADWLSGAGVAGRVELAGPAAASGAEALAGAGLPGLDLCVRTDLSRVRVRNVLEAAVQDAHSARLLDPLDLVPEYLRPSQAEIRASSGGG